MIKSIHKFQKSIFVFIFIAIVLASMLFFGVDPAKQQNSNSYAIRISDQEISFEKFKETKRRIESFYRQQFKDNYNQEFEKMFGQQAVDQLINSYLLKNFANALNLKTSNEMLTKAILDNFQSFENYQGYLQATYSTANQFESDLKEELTAKAATDLIDDFVLPNENSAKQKFIQENSSYDINYLEFSANLMEKSIDSSKFTTNELEEFFEKNANDYETKQQVQYNYIFFNPDEYKKLYQVQPEDIEWFYSENTNKFTNQAKAKVSIIKFNAPEAAKPEDFIKIKEKAEGVITEISSGKNFGELVTQYSEDLKTKFNAGSLGWINEDYEIKQLAKAVFNHASIGLIDIVETDTASYIVNIEEYQPKTTKKLEEVKDQIIEEIQTAEAPAVAAVQAQEAFDNLKKSSLSLVEFAKNNNLDIEATALLEKTKDKNLNVGGLTKAILELPSEKQRLIELNGKYVITEIVKYVEAKIPDFSSIKEQVVNDYKKLEAKKLNEAKAKEALDKIITKKVAKFEDLGTIKKLEKLKPLEQQEGFLANQEIKTKVFKTKQNATIEELFKHNDSWYLVEVTNITPPDMSAWKTQADNYLNSSKYDYVNMIRESLLNKLKSQTEIDVAEGVY